MLCTYKHLTDRLEQVTGCADEGVVWLDLLNPTPEEERQVEACLGLAIPTRDEMSEIEISSRLYHDSGAEFMTITVLTGLDTDDPGTTPITFILKGNVLVSVRYADPKPFRMFLARAQRPEATIPSSCGEMVLQGLLEAVVDRLADWLERVGNEIDGLSRDIFRRQGRAQDSKPRRLDVILEQIGRKGDCLSMAQESLVSIERLTAYHTTPETGSRLLREKLQHLKLIHRDASSLKDHTTFLNDKITFLLDATLGLITLEQNQIIKIFSVAAVAFLPPTLIASIYGMNFDHMPELQWLFGYPWALILMVLSALLPCLYFKRRGWL